MDTKQIIDKVLDILSDMETEGNFRRWEELIALRPTGDAINEYVLLLNTDSSSIKPLHIEPVERYRSRPPASSRWRLYGRFPTIESAILAYSNLHRSPEDIFPFGRSGAFDLVFVCVDDMTAYRLSKIADDRFDIIRIPPDVARDIPQEIVDEVRKYKFNVSWSNDRSVSDSIGIQLGGGSMCLDIEDEFKFDKEAMLTILGVISKRMGVHLAR